MADNDNENDGSSLILCWPPPPAAEEEQQQESPAPAMATATAHVSQRPAKQRRVDDSLLVLALPYLARHLRKVDFFFSFPLSFVLPVSFFIQYGIGCLAGTPLER
jgi:hypothetical protein